MKMELNQAKEILARTQKDARHLPLLKLDSVNRHVRFKRVVTALNSDTLSMGRNLGNIQALQDIRIRDAVIRSMYDLKVSGDFGTLQNWAFKFEFWAQNVQGYTRNAVLACWATSHLMLSNDWTPLKAILEVEEWAEYSLFQLFDICVRHNVPSNVYFDSLANVTLAECLAGASD